jgi:hypothetical protein
MKGKNMGRPAKTNGRIVRESISEIEMCQAVSKRKIRSALLVMADVLGNTDPLAYHKAMKKAQRLMVEAEHELDNAQILARNIQIITIEAAKRGEYRKVK